MKTMGLAMNLKLTILVENYTPVSFGLVAEHGLSILVEYNKKSFLFDTGQKGNALTNSFLLNKDLKAIDKIVLSHGHYDHTGGLEKILQYINREIKVYMHPSGFDKKYVSNKDLGHKYIGLFHSKEYYENNLRADFIDVPEFCQISDGVYFTGQVPITNDYEVIPEALKIKTESGLEQDYFKDDASVVIDTPKGLVVLLGCAHRGIINILDYIKLKLNKNIYAVIGGTHLNNLAEARLKLVKDYLTKEKVSIFAPNHCTGLNAIGYFKSELPDIFMNANCGSVIMV